MTLARIEPTVLQTDDGSAGAFEQLVDLVGQRRAALTTRVYRRTYALWRAWYADHGVNVLDMRPAQVLAFLAAQDVVKGTRQRQLSALRQLAQMLYILTQTDASKRLYDALMMIRAPTAAARNAAGAPYPRLKLTRCCACGINRPTPSSATKR